MVSSLIFRSLSHFKLIFVYVEENILISFFFLHITVQFSKHHLLKRLSFLHCTSCLLCGRLTDHKCIGCFLGTLFFSMYLCVSVFTSIVLF